MLSLSPTLCSTLGWPTENNIRQEQKTRIDNVPSLNCNLIEAEALNPSPPFPSLKQQKIELNDSIPSTSINNNEPALIKKLSHNAIERDRRKKFNNLFASLRSLIPGINQTRKLRIPTTLSCTLKYIPELQKQVERLKQRKGEILASVYNRGNITRLDKERNCIFRKSLPSVSVSQVDEREILIQICTSKSPRSPFSEVLLNLENEGLQVLTASASGSSGEVVFLNLLLQHSIQMLEKIPNDSSTEDNSGIKESVQCCRSKFGEILIQQMRENQRLDCDFLSQKLLSMCDSKQELF